MREISYSPESRQDLLEIKREVSGEFGDDIAKKVLGKITKTIRTLGIHEEMGTELSKKYGISCDYRLFYTQKNYVFYRIEKEYIRIIRVLNEKQDFMQVLFGIRTTTDETEEYWNE